MQIIPAGCLLNILWMFADKVQYCFSELGTRMRIGKNQEIFTTNTFAAVSANLFKYIFDEFIHQVELNASLKEREIDEIIAKIPDEQQKEQMLPGRYTQFSN